MISLTDVGVRLSGREVVSGVTAVIQGGRFTCVIGPNGGGKTSLMRALAGLVRYSGSICLDGEEVSAMPRLRRAASISYLPQSRPVPDVTVGEVILNGRYPHMGITMKPSDADREIAVSAAQRAGVETLLDRRLSDVSGGERQRAYIAMMIAQDTGTLLLDEPAAGLDIKYQTALMELLSSLRNAGRTVVMVCHDLPRAFTYADELLLISGGHLRAKGTPDEMCASSAVAECFGVRIEKSDGGLYGYRLAAS